MVNVKKRNGELVPYNPSKIELSLERVGASKQLAKQVLRELKAHIYDGITTKKIYRIVFNILRKRKKSAASKFGLKTAIAKLGPRGHHFETFIAHILREKGYRTEFRQVIGGKCIDHEIDVVAHKGKETLLAECKFHNNPWTYSPIQDALYSYSRYLDIANSERFEVLEPMLVTNTRFSTEVVKYAKCVRMLLLGWKYPPNNSLEKIIDKKSIYPITILLSLNEMQREKLLGKNIIIIKDLKKLTNKKLQNILSCREKKASSILKEVRDLLK